MVVGCRGMSAMDRLTLGSVSSGLVRHAHCPVAVIHKHHPEPDVDAPILLGIDGSPASEFATAIAFDEASHRRAPLIAMHAWAHSVTSGARLNWTIDEEMGDEALSERLAGWQENYPDVQVKPTVIHEDASRWLVNHSEKAQLIVVGSHGRGGFAGMLLGSVSSAVVHAAEVPVIVARQVVTDRYSQDGSEDVRELGSSQCRPLTTPQLLVGEAVLDSSTSQPPPPSTSRLAGTLHSDEARLDERGVDELVYRARPEEPGVAALVPLDLGPAPVLP